VSKWLIAKSLFCRGFTIFSGENPFMKLEKCFTALRWVCPRAAGLVFFLCLWPSLRGRAQPLQISSTSTTPSICGAANGIISMAVIGGMTPYRYSDDGGLTWQASDTFYNLVAGLYNMVVEDAELPVVMQTATVPLNNLAGPSGIFYTANPASCLDNDGSLDIIPLGGDPPYMYSTDGVHFQPGNLIGGLAGGNPTITVKDHNGCLITQPAFVPLTDNLTLTMGSGTTICQGSTSTLTLTTNANAFNWTPAGGLDNPRLAQPFASPGSTTTYTVTAALGVCDTTGTETITVLPAPQATAAAVAPICPGQSTQLLGGGGVSYQWAPPTYLSSTTIPNPVVQQPQQTITYALNVTGANGCNSIEPAIVQVVVTPLPDVFPGDDTAILIGQTLPLDAVDVNNSGFTSFQWSPAIGLDNPSIQDPVATVTADITYTVTAKTPQGCEGTGSIKILAVTVSDMVVPNAFTPNGDGHNDVLKVHAIGIKDFKYFRVFNRWGQQVFNSANEGAGWDGIFCLGGGGVGFFGEGC